MIDNGDTDVEVQDFNNTYGWTGPSISGVEGGGTPICGTYGVTAYHTMVVIAPDRTILEQDLSTSGMVAAIEGHGGVQQACQEILTSNFTINPVTVVFGNTIFFDDDCLGDPISWNWTFNGGVPATSTDTAVTVLYSTVGMYTVTLEISDGIDTHSRTEYVYVVEPGAPVPDFVASQTTINVGDSIDFYDLTIDGPLNWEWTFVGGDPVHSTDQNPTNIKYNIPGSFNVYLNTGNAWGTAYHTKYSYITVIPEDPIVEVCDTMTNLLPLDPLIVEEISPWGIIPGINSYGITEYAESYDNPFSNYNQINGIRAWVDLAIGASSSSTVRFKVYATNINGKPGTLLGWKDVYIQNMSSNFVHTVYFDDPIPITGDFFIGYQVNAVGANDQFAVSIADDRGATGMATMYFNYNGTWFPAAESAIVNFMHTSMGLEPIACNTTAVEEFEYETDNIIVYPNPSNDIVNLYFGKQFDNKSIIRVYDMMGSLINVNSLMIDSKTLSMDFSNCPSGIYFINLDVDNRMVSKKVMITK